jgi:phosphoglycerate-specific signal transduction histidine kinase
VLAALHNGALRTGRLDSVTTLETLAHELRQPLSAILSNAQAAQRLLDRCTAGELREILDDIVACDKRAAAILRRLEQALRRPVSSGIPQGDPTGDAILPQTQGERT